MRTPSKGVSTVATGFIDINCDMGEGFGVYDIGDDQKVIQYITSANIACGYHAGDPCVMQRTMRLARERGVGIGAHPGLPDLEGFGRRKMDISLVQARLMVLYQLGAAKEIAHSVGAEIGHLKLHGQFSDMALHDEALASTVVDAIADANPQLILVSRCGGLLAKLAAERGLRVAGEAFADRAYHQDGTGVSRKLPGALITDPSEAARRVVRMLTQHDVETVDGETYSLRPDTICVHGDTPNAVEILAAVVDGVRASGFEIRPLQDWL